MADDERETGPEEQGYDPGPSFVENDRPSVRLAELPAWLQTFAANVGESPEVGPGSAVTAEESPTESDQQDEVDQPAEAQAGDSPADLPDWLQEDDLEPAAPQGPVPREPQTSAPSFMITEDDLPEWLRAMPDDSVPDPVATPVPTAAGGEPEATHGSAQVPPISQAWVTARAGRELSDGGSVFALVTSQLEPVAAGYAAARGLGGSAATSMGDSGGDYSKLRGDNGDDETGRQDGDETASRSRVLRIALLALLILVIVVIIIVGQGL